LSWTGGNNLTAIHCSFSYTGKNGVISSAPKAGVDIDALMRNRSSEENSFA
jgi:hypothetical protein